MSEAVTLAVYDLSRGMAAAMSQQILGEQLDGIGTQAFAYSAKNVFGAVSRFFPGVFEQTNGMQVSRLDAMGTTTKTEYSYTLTP